MSKNSKSKSITMRGGKNVAPGAAPPEKTPKSDPVSAENPQTNTPDTPEKPTE